MHHCHPAKFIECRADTGYIRCINWYDLITSFHMQLSHPPTFPDDQIFRIFFSSCQASIINPATFRIPSNPYRPAPSTRLTKCFVPVNHAAFCPIASIFSSFLGRTRISGWIVGSYERPGYCCFSHSNVAFFFRIYRIQIDSCHRKAMCQ